MPLKETLELYDAIVKVFPTDEAELDPVKVFGEKFLTRREVKDYSDALKRRMESIWSTEPAAFQAVVGQLAGAREDMSTCSPDIVRQHFVALVMRLKAEGKLPALVFVFNRANCVRLTDLTVKHIDGKVIFTTQPPHYWSTT